MNEEFTESSTLESIEAEISSENTTAMNEISSESVPNDDSATISQMQSKAPSTKKKGKLLIIILLAAIIVAAIAAFFIFGRHAFSTTSPSSDNTNLVASIADDGTAYLPTMDGHVITINDEVDNALLSKDRKTVVVLLKDGTIYYSDNTLSEKHIVADNAERISIIRNDGFIYEDSSKKSFRVLFYDSNITELGTDIAICAAEDTISLLYSDTAGKIYTLKADASQATQVGSFSDSVYMDAISNDGSISVWTLCDSKNNQSIILNEDDDKTTLGEVYNKYDSTSVTFTKDQKLVVISNTKSDKLWIKKPAQDIVSVNLGNELNSNIIHTDAGRLSSQLSSIVNSLYVKVDGDIGANIYNISLNGDRERILSKISTFNIYNGCAVYTDTEGNLYYSKCKGNTIEEGTKIASDVDLIDFATNGKYVYYMRDCEDNEGSLYGYKIGDPEPKKVASGVACYSDLISYNYTSTDGDIVYYLKDAETLKNTYTDYGTLMMWKYSTGKSEKISSDVIQLSLSSALKSTGINPNGFIFQKYKSIDEDKHISVDIMYFNGSAVEKLASDVMRK